MVLFPTNRWRNLGIKDFDISLYVLIGYLCIILTYHGYNDVVDQSEKKDLLLKFIYSEKATKFLRNLPLTFDYSTYSQKLGEDFEKFCGLLRIYEL